MDETFAQALRRCRGDLSQRAVARLAAVGKGHVGDLESGRRRPSLAVATALDRALGAGGTLVDLATTPAGASAVERAAALHKGLDKHLATGVMSEAGIADWEYTVDRHGRATRYRPEEELLLDLVDDFAVLQRHLGYCHAPDVRRRLSVVGARFCGLIALTLLKAGEPAARHWWRTGRRFATAAADRADASDADGRAILSWIYAQEAYQLYYGGDLHGAVDLANHARHLASGIPCAGPALAASLQARAHAALQQPDETAAALAAAQAALDRLDPAERAASAYGYSASQLHFHAGNAWTHLRDVRRAGEEHKRALELYPPTEYTDRALVQLDQAVCLATDGDTAAAAAHAVTVLSALPTEHRSALILYRARALAATVPATRQKLPEVRELHEMLALPGGEA
ncbi:helix-turn-helix domain-containing protein [Streptomyces sp. URMC 127]|uniref:helix-turn-helix transcriptional regulator n=1 Tax=Streptomyces sp. URMC 127 TaxID=3423402 RepID=UPI003F1E0412